MKIKIMDNSYKYQRKFKAIMTIAILAITGYLLLAVSYDVFISTPNRNKKIEHVTAEFGELKIFLDNKIPQIDSALVIHAKQIFDQNKQLEELNNLTEVLKDK